MMDLVCKARRQMGFKEFREVFKTITCVNGSEFMDAQGGIKAKILLIPYNFIQKTLCLGPIGSTA